MISVFSFLFLVNIKKIFITTNINDGKINIYQIYKTKI